MRLSGTTVVVTGASSGIGAATATAMARHGARHVVLMARRADRLATVAADVTALGATPYAYPVDLADADAVESVATAVRREVGDPHVLVNNAGAGRWLFAEDTSPDEAVAMTAVPYLAAFWLTGAFLPAMLARRAGHVVTVNSPACFIPWTGAAGYVGARWALRGLHESLALERADTGVDASMVVVGKVRSEYFEANPGAEARLPGIARLFATLSPARVADLIVRAVLGRRRIIVRPRLLQATVWLARHAPWLVTPLVRRTGARRSAA